MRIERQTRLAHLPSLDGLRGVAVAIVLVFHASASALPGGYLGVSLFFTLSGFLITAKLLYEHERTGAIGLGGFWLKRIRRLMPALFLALILVALLSESLVGSHQLDSLRGDGLAGLFYVANWRFIASAGAYADQFAGDANPLVHLWSLAIEEQFYLLFPLIAVAALRFGKRWFAGIVGTLLVGSVAATILLSNSGASAERIYFGTDTRAFEILIGAALAFIYVQRPQLSTNARLPVSVAGGLALVAMTIATITWNVDDAIIYQGGLILFASASSVVIASAVWGSRVTSWLFDRSPLRSLGIISYGVYLFHWPIFVLVQRQNWAFPVELTVEVTATLCIAVLSYRLVENPIRRGSFTAPKIAFAPVATVSALVALLVVIPSPGGEAIVFSAVLERNVPPTEQPAVVSTDRPAVAPAAPEQVNSLTESEPARTDRPPRILLVGDSVMLTLGRGLERWGTLTGEAEFLNNGLLGCAIGRGGRVLVEGTENTSPEGCDRWAERWPGILDEWKPDAVVVLTGVWDVNDRVLPFWPTWQAPGDRVFDDWLESEFDEAVDLLGSRGAAVIWLTTPCYERFDESGEVIVPGGTFDIERIQHVNNQILPEVADDNPDLEIIDFYDQVCPDDLGITRIGDVSPVRPDGVHFSENGADAMSVLIGPQLVDAVS